MRNRQLARCLVLAFAAGLLESAWVAPGHGGPTNTWLGVMALLIAFMTLSWPFIHWIPGLAILEEGIHLYFGYGGALPGPDQLFHHWSISYLGFNVYPWITFPIITIVGELFLQARLYRRRFKKLDVWRIV